MFVKNVLRENLINDKVCLLLKKLNVYCLFFGLESGSERMLKYLKRGTVTVEQGKKAMRLCKEYGFSTCGYFMIGSPSETVEDLEETCKFIESPDIDGAAIFITTPLPGTELWDYAIKEKLIQKDFYEFPNRRGMAKFQEDLILSKEITKKDFRKWYELLNKIGDKPRPNFIFKMTYSHTLKGGVS